MAPIIVGFWESAAFPFEVLPGLGKLDLGGATIKGYGCPGQSLMGAAMVLYHLLR